MAVATFTSFTPATAPANAGATATTTTIVGTGFTGTTTVKVNGATATFVITDDTHLVVTLPNGVTGVASVAVTNGTGTATDTTHFTYTPVVVPTRSAIVAVGGVFDSSGTTRFTNNIADQYAFQDPTLFGGSYPTSYAQFLVRQAKIKAVNLFNSRYPDQAITVPTF
jgi:hypothetical protein